ncbi:unknown protein [Microcystis aeruginosa NIES-843]|uniref:Uncharacterized protein n=1 Tax=Microcystis aeruginosa (strain NIES-843 / IAM M-2473) TaxID=449447 RepID=B0JVK0_MICAN|nr:unknown protein [Microcystis aeruginosa NIES-843]
MRLIRDLNPESQKMLERIYRASKHHQVRERAKCGSSVIVMQWTGVIRDGTLI